MKRSSLSNVNSSKNKKFFGSKEVPSYKKVEGTNFAVDAFCYGDIPNVQIYFLSHFHSDHYTGLSSTFNKTVYCSKITGALCMKKLRVKASIIKYIEVNETINVNGIKVSALDANHCPGALMFIFQLKNGKRILHCGDFRANASMEKHPMISCRNFDTIYLDTTYCNPKYDFPTQEKSIDRAISILNRKRYEMSKNGQDFSKLLVICGTYSIGKEKFFLGIAKHYNMKIWCPSNKMEDLRIAINLNSTYTPNECQIHVLPLQNLHYESLVNHFNKFSNFNECIAFKPSGWEFAGEKVTQRNNITIFGIPYSEHSSFTEMKRFIIFCRPNRVISTIPGHENNKKVQGYMTSWLGEEARKTQTKIVDFFKSAPTFTKT